MGERRGKSKCFTILDDLKMIHLSEEENFKTVNKEK